MRDAKVLRNSFSPLTRTAAVSVAVSAATAFVIATFALAPRPAEAMPQYAQQTGLACGSCHVNSAGGGTLKPFGQKFQANGHKLPNK